MRYTKETMKKCFTKVEIEKFLTAPCKFVRNDSTICTLSYQTVSCPQ